MGPCKNPNCHSFGKPHPNCRCYGMAEGGELGHFCSEARMHDEGCEYYSSGGEIPADKVVMDPPHDEIPADKVQIDPEIPADKVVLDSDKYGSTGQTIGAAAEGVAQGVAGPVATWAESHPLAAGMVAMGPIGVGALLADKFMGGSKVDSLDKGISEKLGTTKEDIAGRQAAHPIIHGVSEATGLVGSMLTGVGEGALISKGAAKVAQAAVKSKIGAAALKLFIEGAALTGADETSKALLGRGDPEHPVGMALAHMGAGGLMNVAGGGLFSILGHGLGELGGKAMTDKATKVLQGIADRGVPLGTPSDITDKALGSVGLYETVKHGFEGAAAYTAAKFGLKPLIEKIISKPVGKANQYVVDAILHVLSNENTLSVPAAMRWGQAVGKGAQKMLPAMESIFKAGTTQVVPPVLDKLKDELKKNIEEGTLQSEIQDESQQNSMEGYAKGGQVAPKQPDHFGVAFPEQNILMNQARGRVSGYLNALRPLPGQKLAFDEPPGNTDKKRSYDKAINLAANPLHILNHIQAGDLTPEDMKHFTSLWPELYRVMSGKLTDRITKAQLAGEKPSYAKRQALSLFLGAPLDSSLRPAAIQAAQAVFAQKKAAQQPQQGMKKRKAPALTKLAESHLTDDDARAQRQQKA